jgi:hypothetical protein
VNYSQDNIADILYRELFAGQHRGSAFLHWLLQLQDRVAPRFKGSPSWKRMTLLRGLEAFNRVAGVFGMGMWPTIQVLARK